MSARGTAGAGDHTRRCGLLLALILALSSAGSAIHASPGAIRWIDSSDLGPRCVVRLDLALGLQNEGEGTWGLAATAEAALRVAPSRRLATGELEPQAAHHGLTVHTTLGRDHISISFHGPAAGLDAALWLAADRLDLLPPKRARGKKEHVTQRENPPFGLAMAIRQAVQRRQSVAQSRALAAPVHAMGSAADATMASLFGPLNGHRAYSSRAQAAAHSNDRVARALHALPTARARLTVVAPAAPETARSRLDALSLPALVTHARRSEGLAPPLREPSLDATWLAERPQRLAARQEVDARRFVAAGWDFSGLGDPIGLSPAETDAATALIGTLLGHAGGRLAIKVQDAYHLAREIEVNVVPGTVRALIITAEARGRETADLRQRLIDEATALGRYPASYESFHGARQHALAALWQRWQDPIQRAGMVARAGADGRSPDTGWHNVIDAALAAIESVSAQTVQRLAAAGFVTSRQVTYEIAPAALPESEQVVVNADTLATFVRIMVDLRCPAPGARLKTERLLREKYAMNPKRYVALSRLIAQLPQRMRELSFEAELRCQEYAKLRRLMAPAKRLALHRAVACQTGSVGDGTRRARRLRRIYRTFGVDPSIYRPMAAMLHEDWSVRDALVKVARDCPARFGPAAEHRL